MIEKILKWDTETFLSLNFDGGAFLDAIMWYFSWIGSFIILVIFFLYLMRKSKGIDYKHMIMLVIFLAIIVLLADQTSNFFKANVPKLRPSHNPELKGLIHSVGGYIGGLYGTVSGHAANSFGIATFLVLAYNKRWFTYFTYSYVVLIAYSRIYLGVHYPLDLIFGTMFGLLYGYLIYLLYKKVYLTNIKTK